MRTHKGNTFYIEGVFAYTLANRLRLTAWESEKELFQWVDEQYED